MVSSRAPLPLAFTSKKQKILEKLAVPVSEYDDLSPKGSIDEGIRDLIDEINEIEGCVTTSSCAGRTSIFMQGKKRSDGDDEDGDEIGNGEVTTRAGIGGKGGGGKWLYVSHSPLDCREHNDLTKLFGMHRRSTELSRGMFSDKLGSQRWVHFKFEPMILHILTASLEQAQIVLSAALQAGFRESGALNLVSSTSEPAIPIVAVRSMGLSLESIIGVRQGDDPHATCTTSEESLEMLVEQANERFTENTKRIERFQGLLKKLSAEAAGEVKRKGQDGEEWEDPQIRRERKRAEGLAKSQELKSSRRQFSSEDVQEPPGLELLDQNK